MLIAALVVGLAVVLIQNVSRRRPSEVPDAYRYSTESYAAAERDAVHPCHESAAIPLSLLEPRALSTGPDGAIAVVGDRALLLLDREGRETRRVRLDAEPTCVAWGNTKLFIGFTTHIEVYSTGGDREQAWQALGENAWLTSLAVGPGGVFAADYGQRLVWHLDFDGRLVSQIDGGAAANATTGFIMPSPYFDVATQAETVWITNPGQQRVEAYDATGKLQRQWGRAGTATEDFCGCCNPSHLALMPDGRFVTSEKGMPRVKLYANDGTLLGVVAASDSFPEGTVGLDLAVDSSNRILVLEPKARRIRVFEENSP